MIRSHGGIEYTNILKTDFEFKKPLFAIGDSVYLLDQEDHLVKGSIIEQDYANLEWRYTIRSKGFDGIRQTVEDGDIWVEYDRTEFDKNIERLEII